MESVLRTARRRRRRRLQQIEVRRRRGETGVAIDDLVVPKVELVAPRAQPVVLVERCALDVVVRRARRGFVPRARTDAAAGESCCRQERSGDPAARRRRRAPPPPLSPPPPPQPAAGLPRAKLRAYATSCVEVAVMRCSRRRYGTLARDDCGSALSAASRIALPRTRSRFPHSGRASPRSSADGRRRRCRSRQA